MKQAKRNMGRILYALTFLFVIPAVLLLWAAATEVIVHYPAIQSAIWGAGITALGVLLIFWGWYALKVHGKGLPMNAFPPVKLVRQGPYRFIRHPIYWGFGLLMVGVSIWTGSASGLWLVTPVTILGMIAIVWGYEKIDLQKRFPESAFRPILSIPGNVLEQPRMCQRIAGFAYVAVAMVLTNSLIGYLTDITAVIEAPLFMQVLTGPVSLLFVLAVPFVLGRQDQLRSWVFSALLALVTIVYVALIWPALGAQFLHTEGTQFRHPLLTTHIALLAVSTWPYITARKRFWLLLVAINVVLIYAQFTVSGSSASYLIVGIVISFLAIAHRRIWIASKNLAQRIANSWKEWVIGPVRIINHGIYVGVAAMLNIIICGLLVGSSYAWALLAFAVVVIVFSALWAQVIEGSERLKRPFGYYGALVGIVFAALTVWAMGYNVWVIIGVVSVAMPWTQAIGRLRCLINGCCHGSRTPNTDLGIRYFHHRSRVCGISGLKGEMLHPTPLYSIVWLFFVGFILLALWLNLMPLSFIFGMYLVLTGLGRFVEEAYRGEVQTPVLWALRLYQWTAIASVVVGIVFTALPSAPVEVVPDFSWDLMLAALFAGLFTFIAMGVDFPRSNARFSRLV